MTEAIAAILSAAVSNLYIDSLREHESCYLNGRCLYYWNAACAEQTMRQCTEAQEQLAPLIGVSLTDTLMCDIERADIARNRSDSAFCANY